MARKIIIIAHIIHREISEEECIEALPEAWQNKEFVFTEVRPYDKIKPLGEKVEDWVALKEQQKQLFENQVQPYLRTGVTIAYFAAAPIPAMLHLGSLLHDYYKVKVFTYHRTEKEWYLDASQKNEQSILVNYKHPLHKNEQFGNVIIRLSVSAPIAPTDTYILSEPPLQEIDISVTNPQLDALSTEESVMKYADTFIEELKKAMGLYPQAQFHLFAAMPTGLSFLIASKISPTMQASLQTYQYQKTAQVIYEPAVAINPIVKTVLVLTACLPHQQFINVKKEADKIEKVLTTKGNAREQYQVIVKNTASYQDALLLLEEHKPTIVHIASHGDETGVSLGFDRTSRQRTVPSSSTQQNILNSWETVFEMYQMNVQCVILNACQSKEMANRVAVKIQQVVGFSGSIHDRDAINFSEVFYRSLSNEYHISNAFEKAKSSVRLNSKGQSICLFYKGGQLLE
ncbi:SAVED domain-containing protein [Microscilla marina]|uniref:CHAT domain-containing protein n=1 Tax=Microscilla marina ATCC 23134 TaxID=313606 RepID=A1ZW70_MICM2|nr:SAVED domain-containing protein [Microscilla marina]EAY25433.1 hypothetical protein M23134_06692 [Microscilla marina ATCC 23134]